MHEPLFLANGMFASFVYATMRFRLARALKHCDNVIIPNLECSTGLDIQTRPGPGPLVSGPARTQVMYF